MPEGNRFGPLLSAGGTRRGRASGPVQQSRQIGVGNGVEEPGRPGLSHPRDLAMNTPPPSPMKIALN
jgi:hypothetical protein